MKRTAVIGLGSVSVVHIDALVNGNFAKIEAICDILPERIESTMKDIPYDVRTYTDYKVMLEEVKPEVVHICTPHFLHKDMAIAAMKSGADVYLEKPVGLDYDEALEVIEVEKQTGRKVCVSFQNRVIPTNLTAKNIVASGELGEFLGARGFMTWDRSGTYYSESPWRGKWATEGGGVLMNQSIHTLDLLYYLGGNVTKTEGSVALRKNSAVSEVEDTAEATLFYENGKTAVFYATNCNVLDSSIQVEVFLEKGRLLLHNTCLYKDTGNGYELLIDDSKALTGIGKIAWGNGHQMMMKRFYSVLDGNDEYYCSLEDGAKVLKIIGDIYKTSPNKLKPAK